MVSAFIARSISTTATHSPRRCSRHTTRPPSILAASSAGYKSAQELKGAADAKATTIYAKAYGRDAELYQFIKAMETLESSLDAQTTLVMSTDSDLLRYLKGGGKP